MNPPRQYCNALHDSSLENSASFQNENMLYATAKNVLARRRYTIILNETARR
ncbi:MAG: hypothetical protein ACR2P5_04400 [Gammaproteobacteria bacterium]